MFAYTLEYMYKYGIVCVRGWNEITCMNRATSSSYILLCVCVELESYAYSRQIHQNAMLLWKQTPGEELTHRVTDWRCFMGEHR